MKHSLWGDGSGLDEAIAAYTAGDDRRWDQRLLRWDIIGTMGHIGGLAGAGLLTPEEHADPRGRARSGAGRRRRRSLLASPKTTRTPTPPSSTGWWTASANSARRSTPAARATTRSWPPCGSTSSRRCFEIEDGGHQRPRGRCSPSAAATTGVVMPGFTHIRRAMPSSVGLWAAGYAEVLLDDLGLLDAAYDLADRGPLGSAAGYGIPLPLDRPRGLRLPSAFASPQLAVTAVQLSRGKLEATVLSALWAVARDLAALAWDVVLFSADEYGYFVLPAELATGSSIMPQKTKPRCLRAHPRPGGHRRRPRDPGHGGGRVAARWVSSGHAADQGPDDGRHRHRARHAGDDGRRGAAARCRRSSAAPPRSAAISSPPTRSIAGSATVCPSARPTARWRPRSRRAGRSHPSTPTRFSRRDGTSAAPARRPSTSSKPSRWPRPTVESANARRRSPTPSPDSPGPVRR